MVNILIISHSFAVAKSICELISEMKNSDFIFTYLGGISEGELFGTDPTIIADKLTELTKTNDTLVFCDMGSSLLNTQMAIEFLPAELQTKIAVAESPYFEGILTAVVTNQANTTLLDLKNSVQKLWKI